MILDRLLNWSTAGAASLPFFDEEEIKAIARPAVFEAYVRGIMKGEPEGYFLPLKVLSRAEIAVIIAATLRDLDIVTEKSAAVSYADSAGIPAWAAGAVAETTAAGIFHGRSNGLFAAGDPVTAGELAVLLERLITVCADYAGE